MDQKQKEKNIETVKSVLKQYLQDKGYRNTPERYAIIEEIYNLDHHFNVDDLYLLMIQKKYQVSKATIYNTIEIFLDAGLIRKHQFGEKTLTSSSYEKSYFDKQHDHLVVYKPGSDKEIDEINPELTQGKVEELNAIFLDYLNTCNELKNLIFAYQREVEAGTTKQKSKV